MIETNAAVAARDPHRTKASAAAIAIGIVYGDLGTSPLDTLQTIVQALGGHFTAASALDALSLIFWTLIVTISINCQSRRPLPSAAGKCRRNCPSAADLTR